MVRYYRQAPAETKPLLLQRAAEDESVEVRSAALVSLAQHYHEAPETSAFLVWCVSSVADGYVRSTALSALAQYYRQAPETKALLLQRAAEDESLQVRYAALAALTQHYREAPETKLFLLQRAAEDKSGRCDAPQSQPWFGTTVRHPTPNRSGPNALRKTR